ncbi:MAG: mercuric reductase [Thermomicrobiales bacterium]
METLDETRYDAIVIGAGQAGVPLAKDLARSGRRTALIEHNHLGGTCVNVGCTPSKTMVASARVAHLANRSADYGVETGPIEVDLARVLERKRAIVEQFRSGTERGIEQTQGLDLYRGRALFTGPRSLTIAMNTGDERRLASEQIFINAGGRPSTPDLPGLDQVAFLDSTSIMELSNLPEHLIVLGGGYFGLEFGQMFRRFGSRVTIVQRGSQLIGREDSDIASAVLDILEEDGIDILLDTEASGVAAHAEGLALSVNGKEGARSISGSHLLVATGRTPNADLLDLAAAGIETDERGYITVDEKLATTVEGVFALGDIKGGPAFTHISYDDYRILRSNVIEAGNASTMNRMVPYVVFIDPQLGRIGLSEAEARSQDRQVRVASMPMSSVARALEVDETRGVMKVVIDAQSERILGAAILGLEGGEVMAMVQIAMMGDLPYTALRAGIFAHPTLAESFNNLFATLEG